MKPIYLLAFASVVTFACSKTSNPCIDEDQIDKYAVCTAEYDPVCGCDGKTYGNACEAARAGLTMWKDGGC